MLWEDYEIYSGQRILGFSQSLMTATIEDSAATRVRFLQELSEIEWKFGLKGTLSHAE